MTRKRIVLAAVAALLLAVGGAAAWMLGPALLPTENIEAGIAVKARLPIAMPLRDSTGQPSSLAQAMGPKGMVLILVRSADWCPFCKAQLIRTNEIRSTIANQGYAVASLSYDEPATLAAFAGEKGLGYTLFSDPDSQMIDALALRDPQYPEGNRAYGVPRAAILVVAADGSLQAKHVSADYRSRPSNDDVLAMLKGVTG